MTTMTFVMLVIDLHQYACCHRTHPIAGLKTYS